MAGATLPAVPPKMKLGEALAYLNKYWPRLVRYTERGDLPVDNNIVSVRPVPSSALVGVSSK